MVFCSQVNILRETSDRSMETKIQGGPGTLGPGGKGQRFQRGDWKGGNRRQQRPQQQMQQQQSVQE